MANIKDVIKKLNELGYETLMNDDMISYQQEWLEWYQGFVNGFHEYTAYEGTDKKQQRKVFSLGMGKVISELWADYMYNPETTEIIEDERVQEWWDNKKQDIKFTSTMNNFMELSFASGTGATVEYKDHLGNANIDFIDFDMIIPIETLNEDIVSCAFVSEYTDGVIFLNIHERQDDGTYLITNSFYKVNDKGELQEEIPYDLLIGEDEQSGKLAQLYLSPTKMFQIFKPAIVNNKVLGSPFGISIFGNAQDELKASDIAFDSITKEVQHGKIRVYLKEGALDISIDGEDRTTQTFAKGEEFYILKGDDTFENEGLIKTETPQLRELLIDFMDTHLNLLGRKCGLGNQAFSNQDGTIYTNTAQVISTNSRFYATRQKHGTIMEENIVSIIKALYWLEFEKELDVPISVQMDDSIIHDKDSEVNRMLQLHQRGLISNVFLYQELFNFTEEQAIEFDKNQKALMNLPEEVEQEGDIEE